MSRKRPRALVEAGARPDRERLGDVDLDVVDVVAVPDGLEEAVGEAQRQDVLDGLLAQEVVDAEDLLLGEDSVDGLVQGLRRREVGAEGLLHDHPRALGQTGVAQRADDPGHGRRGNREVDEPVGLAADLLLGPVDGVREVVGGAGVGGRVGEPRGELVPGLVRRLAAAELVDGHAGERPELVVGERPPRSADDPVPLGEQAGDGEVEEAGDQLALGQVARGPKQHDRRGRSGQGRGQTPGRGWCGHGHALSRPGAGVRYTAGPGDGPTSARA